MRVLLGNDSEPSAQAGELGTERRALPLSMIVSAAVHSAVLVVLCWRVGPMFLKPEILARGSGGDSTPNSTVLYFPQSKIFETNPQSAILSLPAAPKQNKRQKRANVLEREKQTNAQEAGSRLGTGTDGPSEGDEIKPGFATTFPDPGVARWELPGGLQGEVIVELTIDEQGKVVEEKLIKGLGHGVDEKVIATLRDWRFRPATRNGIAIPFKYDAHFHFPS